MPTKQIDDLDLKQARLLQRFAWCVIMALLLMQWIEQSATNKRLDALVGALTDTGKFGGPLQRIDHNIAIIGDYGIPSQDPNAPKVVR